MATMGWDFGLEKTDACFKRKYRWLLKIPDISATGIETLPPTKAARPSITYKTLEAQHMQETIYFPGKPDWKPLNLTLFDLRKNENKVWTWIKDTYPADASKGRAPKYKKQGTLEMYDGCGNTIEQWILENMFIESVDFGDLDHSVSDIVYIDVTLRYDRARLSIF